MTLVRYVCDDERVRDHFACIEFFSVDKVLQHAGCCRPHVIGLDCFGPEYLAGVRNILEEPRFQLNRCLLVFHNAEAAKPVDESAWAALMATSKLGEGSKLLFTCGDADLGRILGTADPLVLHPIRQEEYWHYFKAFAFAGADPRDHPRMVAVAREISSHLESYLDARVVGTVLQANFNLRFWRKALCTIVSRPFVRQEHMDFLCNVLPPNIDKGFSFRNGTSSLVTRRNVSVLRMVTQQEMLSAPAASSSSSRTSCPDDVVVETVEGLTIDLCFRTPYSVHSYTFDLNSDKVFSHHLRERKSDGRCLKYYSVVTKYY